MNDEIIVRLALSIVGIVLGVLAAAVILALVVAASPLIAFLWVWCSIFDDSAEAIQ